MIEPLDKVNRLKTPPPRVTAYSYKYSGGLKSFFLFFPSVGGQTKQQNKKYLKKKIYIYPIIPGQVYTSIYIFGISRQPSRGGPSRRPQGRVYIFTLPRRYTHRGGGEERRGEEGGASNKPPTTRTHHVSFFAPPKSPAGSYADTRPTPYPAVCVTLGNPIDIAQPTYNSTMVICSSSKSWVI